MLDQAVRRPDLLMLEAGTPRQSVRSQNFTIEWIEAIAGQDPLEVSSPVETMLILLDTGASIAGEGSTVRAPRRSVVVLPAGSFRLDFDRAGRACVISTERNGSVGIPLNAASYSPPNPQVAAVGPAWPRTGDARKIQVFDVDRVQAPADNPRIKMFQSATISINWVDYQGPRDRTRLSPHSHKDFEQASLAAAGEFVHHLRVDWSKNANDWREDEHRLAPSPSVLVIPPHVIHTTEGVGPGHHLLIDVFAPPRRDFIAKGWVANSAEYSDPSKS